MDRARRKDVSLSQECRFLKGVGPVRGERLKRLGIVTVDDLITHFPRKYYDRRNLARIAELRAGEEASVLARVLTVSQRKSRSGRPIVTAAVGDETGIVQIVWFNQPYLFKQIKPGRNLIVSGELSYFRGERQVVNPEFEILAEELDRELLHTGRIVPVYRLTSGLSQRFLRALVARTLDVYREAVFENLPDSVVCSGGLPSRYEAISEMHFPSDREAYRRALARLKLEELFYLQLLFSLQRRKRLEASSKPPPLDIEFSLENRFIASLPFSLTRSQKRVLEDIHRDLGSGGGMNRLLQGDVGSGKTIVAGATMLCAVEAGFQTALMVPTEVLAVQHMRTLEPYFSRLGVDTALLIGALRTREKRQLQDSIARGTIRVVIGTHALIQEEVSFENLGLVVVDEQHRFGVRQRAALMGRGRRPHMLVMTATPIPRSLALTAYADLDLSVIEEMPPGRAKVKTRLIGAEKREAMLRFVLGELEAGARAYFLYPLIEETEKQDLLDATAAYEEFSAGLFRDVGVGLLHGRMSFREKDQAMASFASGRTGLLISTTVVEVGVHVPEATIMVVHHPERFGLSQLHQLRGRVGRGGRGGYCFLQLGESVSPRARERLGILVRISDGFKIAEEDLKIRGPGEFFGIRQHGLPGFKVANPVVDRRIVEEASEQVKRLLRADPGLNGQESRRCRRYLQEFLASEIALGAVG